MAYVWDWENKMGELVTSDMTPDCGYKCYLYKGNGYMIAVNESDGGSYFPRFLYCDKEQFKKDLGLVKGFDNEFVVYNDVKTIRLNTRFKHVPEIVSMLAKAKMNINIELYYEEEN